MRATLWLHRITPLWLLRTNFQVAVSGAEKDDLSASEIICPSMLVAMACNVVRVQMALCFLPRVLWSMTSYLCVYLQVCVCILVDKLVWCRIWTYLKNFKLHFYVWKALYKYWLTDWREKWEFVLRISDGNEFHEKVATTCSGSHGEVERLDWQMRNRCACCGETPFSPTGPEKKTEWQRQFSNFHSRHPLDLEHTPLQMI